MKDGKAVNLEVANRIIAAAQKAAGGPPVSVGVVDATGQLVALSRADGALPASAELARVKAETAVLFKMPTAHLAAATAIAPAMGRPVALFGGGVPLLVGDAVVGAVGVAGGMPDQDAEIAQVAAKAF